MKIHDFFCVFDLVFSHPADHFAPGDFCLGSFHFNFPVYNFTENAGDTAGTG